MAGRFGGTGYTPGVAVEIRGIAADELVDWVAALHVAFHVDRPPADEAAYRRDGTVLGLRATLRDGIFAIARCT